MIHELKLETSYFDAVLTGRKTFEIRFNDRDYKVDDILVLNEWDRLSEAFTGREVMKRVTYLTNYAQKDGYVVMSIV